MLISLATPHPRAKPLRNRSFNMTQEDIMEQHPHPKGALTFMLIYLVVLSLFWVNSFVRLWLKG